MNKSKKDKYRKIAKQGVLQVGSVLLAKRAGKIFLRTLLIGELLFVASRVIKEFRNKEETIEA